MITIDQEFIDEIVRRILTVVRPDRIILFGSAATGDMTRDSDVDLLVLEDSPPDPHDESVQIRRALGYMHVPFDVIVMDTIRFEEGKNIIGGIAHPAFKYGRTIYEAA